MASIDFIDGGTIAGLRSIGARVKNPRGLVAAVIGRGRVELVAWFRYRNRTPNKLGGRRENFWNKIADSVTTSILSPTSGRIAITDYRFNQKLYGGRIVPKTAGALTIPQTAEAKGLTTRQFERETGLTLFRLKKKGGVLTDALAASIGGQVKIEYILVGAVNQQADPQALPRREDFNAALLDEADKHLTREVIQNKSDTT